MITLPHAQQGDLKETVLGKPKNQRIVKTCKKNYCKLVIISGYPKPEDAGATTSDSSELRVYSLFTKDTLDEKGQARDTRVHVTL